MGQINTCHFVVIANFFSVTLKGKYSDTSHPTVSIHLTLQSNVLSTQLSFIDMMYFSTTMPKMAINFLSNSKTITFLGCKIQTFLFLTLGGTEALLLGFVSYDHYVAICHPLRYTLLMSKMICWFVVTCAWAMCSVNSLIHMLLAFQLPFCSSWLINVFFCEVPSLVLAIGVSGYFPVWIYSSPEWPYYTVVTFHGHSSFLCLCTYCSIPDEFRKRTEKSYLHLFFSPDCGRLIKGRGSSRVLHHYHALFWMHLFIPWGIKGLLGSRRDCWRHAYLYRNCDFKNPLLIEIKHK